MNRWHPLPIGLYSLAERTPGTVLLECSRPGSSRLSRLFANPQRILEARTAAELEAMFPQIEDAIRHNLVAAGFFAYECGQCFEPTATQRPLPSGDLLAWFGIYEHCYCFDHHAGAFINEPPPDLPPAHLLESSHLPVVSLGIDPPDYSTRIAQIHEWIRAGDVYQLNFTFPLRVDLAETPAQLYARLQAAQPVEYSAFLHSQPGRHILSLSPELFFRIDENAGVRRITTRPMKGTASRGRTTVEDREIAAWLASDRKNCAENVMIVDLIRNDLGRICTFGTVHVDKLFEVERFPTLWQMTSTISGQLRPGVQYVDIFRALFPSGSVTGAPKIRAMQLLAQIEEGPRGVYTGAIGFFSREQSVFNVAIRTLTLDAGHATMGIGSGIVIDSDPEAEFRECRLKAEFLTRSPERFSLIETMLWEGGFPLLDLHLDRLEDSADYFDFACDRASIKAAVLEEASALSDPRSHKIRLLLDSDGTLHIESGLLAASAAGIARVCIASERTSPADRFLFHKTTHRSLYDRAFVEASADGFADVLFLNTQEQLTEGAISNVIVETEGRWYTPPIECGLLPGVYRRHLLQTRSNLEERILTLADVQAADAIYICNALRGLRKIEVSFPRDCE